MIARDWPNEIFSWGRDRNELEPHPKRMKKIAFAILALGWLLASCSRKQTSTPSELVAWHDKTLTKAYDTVGIKNPAWDEPAKKALAEYVKVRAQTEDADSGAASVGEFAQEAIQAGCEDPMIRYLYCRFAPEHASKPLKYWQDEFRKAAQGVENSGYSPLLKFYANDRAADMLWQNQNRDLWQEVAQFRWAAMNDIVVALQDKSMPIQEVADSVDALLETISASEQEMTNAYPQIEGPLFKNWPDTSTAYFIKGKFYYRFAWIARGGGYADKVSEAGWDGFRKDLAVAEAAYRKAWALNPKDVRIPTEMIEMAVSQQRDRAEMELWFQRGMQLNTNNHDVCAKKLRYLMPQWYGSREDMVAFGRECVASTKWGGRVPLVLAEAHYEYATYLEQKDRDAYWRQPAIWPDIQASYKKFFELNPNPAGSYQYSYAYYAFVCGQWDDFNAQIKLIRDRDVTVDAGFFGGQEVFDKMVEQAKAAGLKN